jgi:hypothetical protein
VLDGISVKRGSVSVVIVVGEDVLVDAIDVDAIDVDDWTIVLVTVEIEFEQEASNRLTTATLIRKFFTSQPPWFVSRLLPKAHTPGQLPHM